jgi:hypothetical protein
VLSKVDALLVRIPFELHNGLRVHGGSGRVKPERVGTKTMPTLGNRESPGSQEYLHSLYR